MHATAILKMPSQALTSGRSGLISGSSTDLPQNCHPDRSLSSPKGMRSGAEGSAVSSTLQQSRKCRSEVLIYVFSGLVVEAHGLRSYGKTSKSSDCKL